ncbi:MAG: T9SS type A sorting domain-containing protein, partial [Flavobacterium sp.]
PVYNYNVAKAATGAMLHFAVASTVLSENSYNEDFQVSFFPNPVNDFLNINFGTLTDSNYTFSIVDINGKRVLERKISNPNLLEKVDISQLQSGVYLVALETSNKVIRRKIIVQ